MYVMYVYVYVCNVCMYFVVSELLCLRLYFICI